MNELFVGLCSYLALQGSGDRACRATTSQIYNQSTLKPQLEEKQKELERYGLGIYETLPLNKPLGALSAVGYEFYKKDFKLSLTNRINLEYTNFNSYTCNLKWEF